MKVDLSLLRCGSSRWRGCPDGPLLVLVLLVLLLLLLLLVLLVLLLLHGSVP